MDMKLTIAVVILIALAVCIASSVIYGLSRWRSKTEDVRAELKVGRLPIAPTTYDPREIEDLPSTPWEGRFSSYARRGDMLIPLEGEVEWQLSDGPFPYWRGSIVEIEYEFAR